MSQSNGVAYLGQRERETEREGGRKGEETHADRHLKIAIAENQLSLPPTEVVNPLKRTFKRTNNRKGVQNMT